MAKRKVPTLKIRIPKPLKVKMPKYRIPKTTTRFRIKI